MAKGGNGPVTNHDTVRRMVKQRQRANAAAKALHKKTDGLPGQCESVLAEAAKEQRKRDFRKMCRDAEDQAPEYVQKVLRQGSLRLSPVNFGDNRTIFATAVNAIIREAKRQTQFFQWNRDWFTKGEFLIGLPKRAAA